MIENIKLYFKRASIFPIMASLFLVPIFYNPSFVFSFTQGKELIFKMLMVFAGFLFAIYLAKRKELTIKNISKSPIFIILVVQLSVYAITNALSSTPIVTLYGTYTRGMGFIMELFLFFFAIYCGILLSAGEILKGLKVVFFSCLLVAMYGLMQKIGLDPLFNNYDTGIFAGRIFSSLGNPSYLGQLILLSLIIGAYLTFREQLKSFKIYYFLGTLIMFTALMFSETRTSLFGLGAAILLVIIKQRKEVLNFVKQNILPVMLVFLLIIGLMWKVLPEDRYSLSSTSLRSLNSRQEIWKGAVKLIERKPILGYGEKTFYIYFPEVVTKEFLTLEENIDTNADRIHNETLEIFFDHGVLGFISYIALLFATLWYFFKSKNKLLSLLALVIFANSMQNQFGFPDISINIIIAFLFGSIVSLTTEDDEEIKIILQKWKRYFFAVITIILCLWISFITIYKPYQSQIIYKDSREHYGTDFTIAVNKLKEAINYTPYYSELWYELMMIDPSSKESSLPYLEKIDGNSGDVLAWKGNLYAKKDPQKASDYYLMALDKNPHNPNWVRAFADMLYANGDYGNALYLYKQYLDSIPDFWKWGDELYKHTSQEQKSYNTFLKKTPYFMDVIKRIDEINKIIGAPYLK